MEKQNRIDLIPLAKIKRPQRIDRIDISDQAISELADNIREQGLLQNPLVRKVDGLYEIIAGDRRILAIAKLGWIAVPCVICDMTDVQAAEARASENLQRVNLTVIEEAKIYENLLVNHALKVNQIAERMGITGATVKRRLDLLKMPQSLQDAMHKKLISYGVAESLAPIADQTALEYYLGFACDHGCTVTIARQWANDWKSSMRRRDADSDPASAITSPAIQQPTYLACDVCHQPEQVQDMAYIKLCRNCLKRLPKIIPEDE